ncbi:MAG: HAD family phosphatase [Rhizobiales bacterium]|nr:HAD family phosphatase [Hyphomicrobiales bacterium]MBI3673562.1 HAD family phosphatase [Hyphomicrobiales bacterium]
MNVSSIIFDCDGVLVDSEPLSMRVDVELLAESGVVMAEDEAHRRFVGKTFAAMIAEVERDFAVRFPPGVSAEKDRRLLALFARELKPVAGVAQALAAIGGRYSVASNSPGERVAQSLRLTGLTPYFEDRIVTFEHVARAKPEPDVFVEAARRVGALPGACLVVEDSVTGVTAAARAGCRVLGFTGTHGEPDLHGLRLAAAGALTVFARMADLPALVGGFLSHA